MITLSRTALLILGVIADEPVNPYAISRIISFKRRHLRGKIPDSTVYGIITMLHKNELVTGKKIKNENTPDRTVYSITAKGRTLLKQNLMSFLSTPEDTLSELPLSLFLAGLLEKDQVLKALKEYQEHQQAEVALMGKMVDDERQRGIPGLGLSAIEYILQVLQLNLETVGKVIRQIEAEDEWTRPQVPFWRDEYTQQKQAADR